MSSAAAMDCTDKELKQRIADAACTETLKKAYAVHHLIYGDETNVRGDMRR